MIILLDTVMYKNVGRHLSEYEEVSKQHNLENISYSLHSFIYRTLEYFISMYEKDRGS